VTLKSPYSYLKLLLSVLSTLKEDGIYDSHGDIKALNETSLENVTEFNYLGSNIASSEKDIKVRIIA